jgi:hypothetical protein
MIQEILTYRNLVNSIDDLINKSPFKKNYIIEQIGIPSPTFYRKLKTLTFTTDEMLQIAKILSPEEYYLMELKESIKAGKLDYKEGRFTSHDEAVKEIMEELSK